jgi:epoxyqueuosine reductase
MTLADDIRGFLETGGAGLVGFADLSVLPAAVRFDLPGAVAFAVALAPDVVAGIEGGPTRRYYDEYRRANALLGELSLSLAGLLRQRGFRAVSSAATNEGIDPATLSTLLPQKTVATLAGLGWIGKCALLVTEPFGSAVRLNRVLTDAPLPAAAPGKRSRCGDCRACVDACPASAPTGEPWEPGRPRDEFFDARACRRGALAIARLRTGIEDTFCGICIAVCPWTRKVGVRAP